MEFEAGKDQKFIQFVALAGLCAVFYMLLNQFLTVCVWPVPILTADGGLGLAERIVVISAVLLRLIKILKRRKVDIYVLEIFCLFIVWRTAEYIEELLPAICWVCVAIIGYYFTKLFSRELLRKILTFFFYVFAALFFYNIYGRNSSGTYYKNLIYYLLIALPIVLTSPKIWVKGSGSALICFGIIIVMKRAALIAVLLGIALYLVLNVQFYSNTKQDLAKNILILGATICVAIVTYLALDNTQGQTILTRLFEEDIADGSGRRAIYTNTWNGFWSGSFADIMLGHGYAGVKRFGASMMVYTSAHNDFLEVLFDYGLVGFGFFVYLLGEQVAVGIRLLKERSGYIPAFWCSMMLFVIISMFSHLMYYPTYFLLLVLYWACCTDEFQEIKEKTNENRNPDLSNRNQLRSTAPKLQSSTVSDRTGA